MLFVLRQPQFLSGNSGAAMRRCYPTRVVAKLEAVCFSRNLFRTAVRLREDDDSESRF